MGGVEQQGEGEKSMDDLSKQEQVIEDERAIEGWEGEGGAVAEQIWKQEKQAEVVHKE